MQLSKLYDELTPKIALGIFVVFLILSAAYATYLFTDSETRFKALMAEYDASVMEERSKRNNQKTFLLDTFPIGASITIKGNIRGTVVGYPAESQARVILGADAENVLSVILESGNQVLVPAAVVMQPATVAPEEQSP